MDSKMKNYEILGTVGEGAHGIVLKAIHVPDGNVVALKKIAMKRLEEGVPLHIIREIKALQYIEHENIVPLIDAFPQGLSFVMVLEFMPANLYDILIENRLSGSQIKTYMLMILRGLDFMHTNHIMHRDLKPANLLIAQNSVLKIGDFGQCRLFFGDEERAYSHQVATRWYRAPELLYGARYYNERVDIWSLGCILGEMLKGEAIFQGENDIDQLYVVISSLGSPDDSTWPGRDKLPDYKKISFSRTMPGVPLEDMVPSRVPGCTEFLAKFLLYDATKRVSANLALLDEFFETEPLPSEVKDLPAIPKTNSQSREINFEDFDASITFQASYRSLPPQHAEASN